MLSDQWIDESLWKAAKRANMLGTAIPEQMKILENDHWRFCLMENNIVVEKIDIWDGYFNEIMKLI